MKNYTFTVRGQWQGGRQGTGHITSNGLDTDISLAPSMDGQGIGTNPDELLIAAVQSCYLMTLGIHLNAYSIPFESVSIQSEGIVSEEGGLHFQSITHYPILTLEDQATEDTFKAAQEVIASVDQYCMIAKALKGNVDIAVHPTIVRKGSQES
ncbi:peroxiredoxin-like protein [Pullulanibacillus pueri]|uniref:Peroxiredoxin, SACOL1771 subfamily n=1 Tax=Pullulanibacillus pueri TaxID=1437324 RepID=A0A8J2ZY89_9BACL|nr:OsmC family protein [Pullulanibacillus pueri]MBM7680529.1 peroxiredoxin-like protein [Pullulanibacillus pueri]GGH86127.1 hypothetical protein GCM10007096_33110 [Pullulanibacillus pueri]